MKWAIALLLLTTAAPALACPPPPPGYQPLSAEEAFRRDVERTPNIVYAVVETTIREEGSVMGRLNPGSVRILHVYKGDLRPGQRIPMYGVSFSTDCGSAQYSRSDARRGAYGILLLEAWDGHERMPFDSFWDPAAVEEMFRQGLIRSARAAPEAR